MFDRIKKYATPQNVWKGYNLLTAAAVAYALFTDPKASTSEYVGDIAIHLLQVAIDETSSTLMKGVSFVANASRIGQIFVLGSENRSTVPWALNLIDSAVNHTGNIAATTAAFFRSRTTTKATQTTEAAPALGKKLS